MPVREQLVFGQDWIDVEFPDDAHFLSPGVSLPLPAAPDLGAAVQEALDAPLDTKPLAELARGKKRVCVAFDDPTVPCFAPLWSEALPRILAALSSAGVPESGVTLLCANALHRKFDLPELAGIIGEDLVQRFAPRGRLLCHDAEDPDALAYLGKTPEGDEVEIHRLVTESDLCIYLNASTTRGFSGGWKSVCVGLSSYRSIRAHHTPDTMSMTTEKNKMHEILDRMGALIESKLGKEHVFKVETVLANPLEVHRVFGGTVAATRAKIMEITRAHVPPRRTLVPEKVDVVVYGVPDWSPYASYSVMNPLLTLISTGLGYLGGMVEAVGKPGCSVVLATPCPDTWDDVHHPSYREVWNRVLPATRDPFVARRDYEPEFAGRRDLIDKYRHHFGFHPVHGIMALYPLKRLRHAKEIIVAGAVKPELVKHAGFVPVASVEAGLERAKELHGPHPSVAVVRYPPAVSRQLAS